MANRKRNRGGRPLLKRVLRRLLAVERSKHVIPRCYGSNYPYCHCQDCRPHE